MARIELITDGSTLQDYYCEDEWKSYVLGDVFDEAFVLIGNRDYNAIEEASWWKKVKLVLSDLDNYAPIAGRVFDFYTEEDNVSHKQRKAMVQLYEECHSIDNAETIMAGVKILYPEMKIAKKTLHGSAQREWVEVVYDTTYEDQLDDLEDWFFGQITEVHFKNEDEDCWCPIPDHRMWQMQRESDFKKELLKYIGEDENLECEIYEQDGYIMTTKWKKVG